ncbi:hypothetical protein, partial [Rahnella sp. CFA14(1/10)]|uniref:hypothetical protein n=1 Tax=Rahnella sp. CFA14(1/10) TaxID=2511203 RepID=UPI00197F19E6
NQSAFYHCGKACETANDLEILRQTERTQTQGQASRFDEDGSGALMHIHAFARETSTPCLRLICSNTFECEHQFQALQ